MAFRLAETDKDGELGVVVDNLEISDEDLGAADTLVVGNANLII